jgi:hypothetical protein
MSLRSKSIKFIDRPTYFMSYIKTMHVGLTSSVGFTSQKFPTLLWSPKSYPLVPTLSHINPLIPLHPISVMNFVTKCYIGYQKYFVLFLGKHFLVS